MRWWLWGSWLVVIAAVVLLAVEVSRDWSWQVFTAGLAVAAFVAGSWVLPFAVVLNRRGDQLPESTRVMVQHRIVLYGTTLLLVGSAVAIMAATLHFPWILIAYICLWAVMALLALTLFAVQLRRLRRRHS